MATRPGAPGHPRPRQQRREVLGERRRRRRRRPRGPGQEAAAAAAQPRPPATRGCGGGPAPATHDAAAAQPRPPGHPRRRRRPAIRGGGGDIQALTGSFWAPRPLIWPSTTLSQFNTKIMSFYNIACYVCELLVNLTRTGAPCIFYCFGTCSALL